MRAQSDRIVARTVALSFLPSSRRTNRAGSRWARSHGCRSSCLSSSPWRRCYLTRAGCWPSSRAVLLGVLVILKILDIGFFTAFDRPFDPFDDWSYAGIGSETLRAAVGRSHANLALAGAIVLVVAPTRLRSPAVVAS